MRCKQGDLAIINYVPPSKVGHRFSGHIVKCVSLAPPSNVDGGPCWWTDPPLRHPLNHGRILRANDKVLTPIRPQPDDVEDEMIKLVGCPTKEPVIVKKIIMLSEKESNEESMTEEQFRRLEQLMEEEEIYQATKADFRCTDDNLWRSLE